MVLTMLDRQVIDGRADETAAVADEGQLTYAQLVERSAAVAGGLKMLGVRAESTVSVKTAGLDRIIVLWAIARIHAEPAINGRWTVSGEPATVSTNDNDVLLTTVEHTGRHDPAPAPRTDPPGYADRLTGAHPDVFGTRT